ncbi:MAG: hypothetical protein HQ523_01750 [Lentisphaerae bacterium]|nr:hypothetical protein [Lentisphaerota bacterium]
MELDVTVVSRENLSAGFGLAGAEAISVGSTEEARKELMARASHKSWSLVLVDEGLFAALEAGDRQRLVESDMPIFVPLPMESALKDMDGAATARERVTALVQHAIGKRLAIAE